MNLPKKKWLIYLIEAIEIHNCSTLAVCWLSIFCARLPGLNLFLAGPKLASREFDRLPGRTSTNDGRARWDLRRCREIRLTQTAVQFSTDSSVGRMPIWNPMSWFCSGTSQSPWRIGQQESLVGLAATADFCARFLLLKKTTGQLKALPLVAVEALRKGEDHRSHIDQVSCMFVFFLCVSAVYRSSRFGLQLFSQ